VAINVSKYVTINNINKNNDTDNKQLVSHKPEDNLSPIDKHEQLEYSSNTITIIYLEQIHFLLTVPLTDVQPA
jgi:hypothetical protein